MRKLKPKILIFDFDGTLADTRNEWYSANLKILKLLKISSPEQEVKSLLHLGEKINEFMKEIGFKKEAEEIEDKVEEEFIKIFQIKFCEGFEEIKKLNIKKIILSNSPTSAIEKILKPMNLKFFSRIYGSDKFTKKFILIKDLMKKHKLKKQEVIYIGDRVVDVEVARKAGCISVIVASRCAWNPKKDIIKANPDYIVGSLRELRRIIC